MSTTTQKSITNGTPGAADERAGARMANGLGWFSLCLGVAQVVAPGRVTRLIGLRDGSGRRAVMRAVGVREIASGVGILARRRPAGWLWARVAGDAVDLGLLGAALNARDARRARVTAAIAAVAGVTVPDVVSGKRLSRAPDPAKEERMHVNVAITVNRPPEEVYAFWRDFENLPRFMTHLESVQTTGDRRSHWKAKAPAGRTVEWDAELVEDRPGELISWRSLEDADVENSGSVRFSPAPGGRGTEVRVELRYSPPGGGLGVTLAKLFGEEPALQTHDDLRRFKQVLETGEVVRTEGSPRGEGFLQQLVQRAAQPLGATESEGSRR
jgi:uncharacterized membrane protein